MIRIKDIDTLDGMLIHATHPILIALLKWTVVRYSDTVFTCGWEQRKLPSVHSMIPLRGMDIRSRIYDDPQSVADDINAHWEYDHERPEMRCAIYHDTGRGPHIHLQVSDHTKYTGALKHTKETKP